MTIATADTITSITGNGVTTAIPVPFVFFGAGELEVIERVIATGVETVKVLSTDYLVTGGNGDTGTVTANAPPPATVQWFVRRDTARTQLVDLTENDKLPAETLERMVDRAIAVVQELAANTDRALSFPATDPASALGEIPNSVQRASKYLAFGPDGKPVVTAGTADATVHSAFGATWAALANLAAAQALLGIGSFALTLLDDTDAAAARATLGLTYGVGVRERLTAARTYYVRTDGNDANTGLANTAGGAFLTIQKAIDTAIKAIDTAGFDVTVQLGDGTYTGGAFVGSRTTGGGSLTIQGNAATPANVVISTTNADAVRVDGSGMDVYLKDFELRTTTAGQCLVASGPSRVTFSNLRFGACAGNHILVDRAAYIRCSGNYSIVGGAARHWLVTNGPGLLFVTSVTVTLSGTPAFTVNFADASNNGAIICNSNTFSGSATGTRYSASANGVINTNGGGASYLPGNAAGATSTGGQYI